MGPGLTGSSGADEVAPTRRRLRERVRAVARLEGVTGDLLDAATQIAGCFRQGGKLLVFGNGGSDAQAQHLAAEFVGRFSRERKALPALALATDGVIVTSLANDFGFTSVFARQIEALGRPGDVAIAISTSGSSPNVLAGVTAARAGGLVTVGLVGRPDSELHSLVDVPIVTPGPTTARVQELHLVACHLLCEMVDDILLPEAPDDPWPDEQGTLSIPELLRARARWRDRGLTVVWTNGCFDLLHAGHVQMLASARRLGDVLVVGVNDDASVKRLKGPGRPVVPLEDRVQVLLALEAVDYAVALEADEPSALLEALKPDIHCKGGDYAGEVRPVPERETVERAGGTFHALTYRHGRSTTAIVDRIRQDATQP